MLVEESARVFTVILNDVPESSRESVSRHVDRVIIDINNTLNATNYSLTRSVATKVAAGPLIERHSQLNERILNTNNQPRCVTRYHNQRNK